MKIIALAPGKAILFGEHFVVKGRPAIAVALGLKLKVEVQEYIDKIVIVSKNTGEKLVVDPETLNTSNDNLKQLIVILRRLKDMCGFLKPAYIEIHSNIPIAAGLGSSASLAVAFTAAFSRYLGLYLNKYEISNIAYEAEKITHGKPSGIDNTIASIGGAILYHKGSIQSIDISKLDKVALIIADTGIERSTREAVLKVLSLYERYPKVMEKIYDASEEIVYEAKQALSNGEWERIGELMNINHGLLSAIGISLIELEKLIYVARRAGALGAKITGAGMGGAIIALAWKREANQVVEALRKEAKLVISTSIDKEGVIIREEN